MKCSSQIVSNCTWWFYDICSYWAKTQMSDISILTIVKCCCHVIGSVYLSSSFQIAVSWVSALSSFFVHSWPKLLALPFNKQDGISAEGDWWNYFSRGCPALCLNEERSLLLVFTEVAGLLYLFGKLAEGRTMTVQNISSFPPASNTCPWLELEVYLQTQCAINSGY